MKFKKFLLENTTSSKIKKLKSIRGKFKTDFFKSISKYIMIDEESIDASESSAEYLVREFGGKLRIYFGIRLPKDEGGLRSLVITNKGEIGLEYVAYFRNIDMETYIKIRPDVSHQIVEKELTNFKADIKNWLKVGEILTDTTNKGYISTSIDFLDNAIKTREKVMSTETKSEFLLRTNDIKFIEQKIENELSGSKIEVQISKSDKNSLEVRFFGKGKDEASTLISNQSVISRYLEKTFKGKTSFNFDKNSVDGSWAVPMIIKLK